MMSKENGSKTWKEGVKVPEVKKIEPQVNWMAVKDKLKEKFKNLTDEDLAFEKGEKEEMFTRVQNKIGKSKEELQEIIAAP